MRTALFLLLTTVAACAPVPAGTRSPASLHAGATGPEPACVTGARAGSRPSLTNAGCHRSLLGRPGFDPSGPRCDARPENGGPPECADDAQCASGRCEFARCVR